MAVDPLGYGMIGDHEFCVVSSIYCKDFLCVMHVCVCCSMYVKIIFYRIVSLLPSLCEFQALSRGGQACVVSAINQ